MLQATGSPGHICAPLVAASGSNPSLVVLVRFHEKFFQASNNPRSGSIRAPPNCAPQKMYALD